MQIELAFCMEIYKTIQLFHLDQCWLVEYVDNFYVTSVSECLEPMREIYHQKEEKKKVKIVPFKLINMNQKN